MGEGPEGCQERESVESITKLDSVTCCFDFHFGAKGKSDVSFLRYIPCFIPSLARHISSRTQPGPNLHGL